MMYGAAEAAPLHGFQSLISTFFRKLFSRADKGGVNAGFSP
jgi:hypothetical protein